jgi:hypothetical protein
MSVELSREEMLLIIRALEEYSAKGAPQGHTAAAIETLLKKLVPYVGSQPGFRPTDGRKS